MTANGIAEKLSSIPRVLLFGAGTLPLLFLFSIWGLEVHAGFIWHNAPQWMSARSFGILTGGLFWLSTLGMLPLSACAMWAAMLGRRLQATGNGSTLLVIACWELAMCLLLGLAFVATFSNAIALGLGFK